MQTAEVYVEEYAHSFQLGEEKGFTYFFEAFYPALLYYAFRMIRDKSIAEEIVEDSFIRTWKRHEKFDNHKQIKCALYKAVSRDCMEWRLTHGSHQPKKSLVQASFENLVRTEVVRKIFSVINKLPPSHRTVFKKIYIQGKTLTQVSEEMNLPEQSLKEFQSDGLQFFKQRLSNL